TDWQPVHCLHPSDSLVDAETNIYTKREGEDITIRCNLTFSGSRKLLCKETCEEGNILIETYGDEDQRGRYSIKYEYRYIRSSFLDVTITKLTKSDSGLYTCSSSVAVIHSNSPQELWVLQEDCKLLNGWYQKKLHFSPLSWTSAFCECCSH
uniref:Immunoglobulin domain-containing protein n=1 Tax=Oryzias latipes TaxID=8090 RepID=A0A3B3HDX5_ORYLA